MAGGKRVIDARFHLASAMIRRHDVVLGGLRVYKYFRAARLFSSILLSSSTKRGKAQSVCSKSQKNNLP